MENKSWSDTNGLVNATVYVDGQEMNYNGLELVQEYGQHDRFTLMLDYDVFGNKFMDNPMNEIKLLGKRVTIEFTHGKSEDNKYTFVGLVTDMRMRAEEGRHAQLVLTGASPTILLERGKRYQAFGDTSLSSVFNQVTEGLSTSAIKRMNNPKYADPIDFLMQYNETDWQFLQRLAYLFGENMHYNGTELVFGSGMDKARVPIIYDKELKTMEFSSHLLHNDFTYYQYLDNYDMTLETSSTTRPRKATNFIAQAREQADKHLHTRDLRVPSEAVVADSFEIQEMTHRRNERTAAKTMRMTGEAKTYIPFVGRLVEVNLPETIDALPIVGTYRIMKATHRIDHNNRYTNNFEGASGIMMTAPIEEPYMPKADSMQAVVISNADPENSGKVKVNFPYGGSQESYWMRVMSTDAGTSDKVSTNRGMVFIPEVGDQVMIGFEMGDPNRPYVMGSLFNGKTGKGGGVNNAVKSIITRSNIMIVFNDDQKSLHIEDPSGNTWDMDGQGNIKVNAPKNMTFTVGENLSIQVGNDYKLEVGANMNSNVGKDSKLEIVGDHEFKANKVKEDVTTDQEITIGGDLIESMASGERVANSGDILIKSNSIVNVLGAIDAKVNKG